MTEDARGPATRDDDDEFVPTPPTSESLAWLRRRLAMNDRLLGYDFSRYQEMEGVSDDQLAAFLGTSVDGLNRMRLTGRPRRDHYNADVRDIARRHGVSAFQLIRLLRSVRFDEAVASAPSAGRLLAAARDLDGEPSDRPDPAVAEDRGSYRDDDESAPGRSSSQPDDETDPGSSR